MFRTLREWSFIRPYVSVSARTIPLSQGGALTDTAIETRTEVHFEGELVTALRAVLPPHRFEAITHGFRPELEVALTYDLVVSGVHHDQDRVGRVIRVHKLRIQRARLEVPEGTPTATARRTVLAHAFHLSLAPEELLLLGQALRVRVNAIVREVDETCCRVRPLEGEIVEVVRKRANGTRPTP